MNDNGRSENRARRETIGAFEIHAVAERDPFERIDFPGENTAIGTIKNRVAFDKRSRISGVLPQRFLTHNLRQNVKPRAVTLAGCGECSQITPVGTILAVSAGRPWRRARDREIRKSLGVVVEVKGVGDAPLVKVAEAGSGFGLFLRARE